MPKHQAVLRIQPVNVATIGGLAAHNNRSESPKFHPDGRPHLASDRTHLNQNLYGSGDSRTDVEAIMAKFPLASKRTTKVCAEAILTAGVDFFDEISPDWRSGKYTAEFKKWVNINKKFLIDEFGPGLASLDLHMDETAPHFHAVIVPVATYDVAYRRGSKSVTKINYNKVIGDDAQVIAQARAAENPELTKLGRLQTRYADALAPVGLVRGLMYSNATHKSLEAHRKAVTAPVVRPKRPELAAVSESVTDKLGRLVGIEPDSDRVKAGNEAKLKAYGKARSDYISDLEKKAKSLPAVIERVSELESSNARKQDKLMKTQEEVKRISAELSLTKAEIDYLRKAPLADVAKALDYDGPITWKGAIDMVKEVSGLSYADAVTFLHESLGADACKQAYVQQAVVTAQKESEALSDEKVSERPRALTRTEYAIKCELAKQLESLDASAYRITLFPSDESQPAFTLNKRGEGEDLYSKERVLDDSLVRYLNYKNWHDWYNIFVTPVDSKAHYVLVDDMTSDTLSKLKAQTYSPSLVLESSKSNFQAVIKVDSDQVTKEDTNAFFKELNAELGDPKIQALSRPFRAVGFKNMKPKHLDQETGKRPIVRLLEASVRFCKKAVERILEISSMTAGALSPASTGDLAKELGRVSTADFNRIDLGRRFMIDRESKAFYNAMHYKYGDEINLSTADFMLCKRLMKSGHTATECAYAVVQNSPSVGTRHPLLDRYIDDTVNAAKKPH